VIAFTASTLLKIQYAALNFSSTSNVNFLEYLDTAQLRNLNLDFNLVEL
jgi:hypothetical protein